MAKAKSLQEERAGVVLELVGSVAPLGAWCLDVEADRFTVVVEPARPLTARRDELELLVRYPGQLLQGSSAQLWADALQRALLMGESWDLTLEAAQPGSPGWLRTVGRCESRAGKVVRLYGVVQDITLARTVERQLRVVPELAPVLAELRGLLAAISEFQQSASEALPEWHPAQDDLAGLAKALERGSSLTGDLLSHTSTSPAESASLDLAALIGDIYPALRRTVGPGILVDVLHSTHLSPVLVDARRIELAILMIAARARGAMAEGGTLTLMTHDVVSPRPVPTLAGVRPPGRFVELSLHDTGAVMDDLARSRVFQPVHALEEDDPSSAAGLAAALRIVREFDGLLDIESAPGEGTTVRLWLPAAVAPAGSPSAGGR